MSASSRTQRTRLKPPAGESNPHPKNAKAEQEPASSPQRERVPTPPLDQEEAQNILLALSNGASTKTQTSAPPEEQDEGQSSAHQASAHTQPSAALSDSGSSSLSELEGTLEDEDALSGEDSDPNSDDAGSDGQSERGSEQEEEDEDTEAETERLDNSPEKRRRDAELLQSMAMGNDEAVDNESALEDEDNADMVEGEDMPSFAPLGADTTIAKELPEEEMAGRKRKRTSSLSRIAPGLGVEPARKRNASTRHMSRTLSVKGDLGDLSKVLEEADAQDAEEEALSDQSEDEKAAEENDEMATGRLAGQIKAPEAGEDAESSGGELSEPPDEHEAAAEAEQEEDDEEGGEQVVAEEEEDEDEEEDEEADAAAKSEDEMARKMAAMEALKPIENLFAVFRDKLFDERLEMLSAELEVLNHDNPDHATFLAMRRALDVRRDDKVALEQVLMQHKLEVLERTTVASQAQLHSQFYQGVRQMRETHMMTLNEHFSRIQRDRRQIKSNEVMYGIKFSGKRAQQIAHQRSYNKEVSLLSGIARHVGFPAAPEIKAPTQTEIDDDLRAMKVRAPQAPFIPSAGGNSRTRQDEGVTEEAWMEKNAWANPNHPVNQQARLLDRQALGNSSPYATPALQRRMIPDARHVPGSGSTLDMASEQHSSAVAPNSSRVQAEGIAFEKSSPFEQMKRRNFEPHRAESTPRAQHAELANGVKQASDGSPRPSHDMAASQQGYRTPASHLDQGAKMYAPRPEPMSFSPAQAEGRRSLGYAGPASSPPPAPPAPSAAGLGVR